MEKAPGTQKCLAWQPLMYVAIEPLMLHMLPCLQHSLQDCCLCGHRHGVLLGHLHLGRLSGFVAEPRLNACCPWLLLVNG